MCRIRIVSVDKIGVARNGGAEENVRNVGNKSKVRDRADKEVTTNNKFKYKVSIECLVNQESCAEHREKHGEEHLSHDELSKNARGDFLGNIDEILFSDDEVYKYSIRKYNEYTMTEWDGILNNIEIDRAYAKALDILLFKKNSEGELRSKLLNKGFSDEVVDGAAEKLRAAGYIDDRRYAISYLKSLNKYKTKYQVEQELLRKGIDSGIIAEVLEDFETGDDEREKIKQFINNKYFKLLANESLDYNKLVSIKRSLYAKGYNPEAINNVVDEIWKDKKSDW